MSGINPNFNQFVPEAIQYREPSINRSKVAGKEQLNIKTGDSADNIELLEKGGHYQVKINGQTYQRKDDSDNTFSIDEVKRIVIESGAGNDVINLSSVKGKAEVFVFAEEGNDSVQGSVGKDYIFGGAGEDFIYGNNGDDVINGNEGWDILDGGAGVDTFVSSDKDKFLAGKDKQDKYVNYGEPLPYSVGLTEIIRGIY